MVRFCALTVILNNHRLHIPDGAEQQEVCSIARFGILSMPSTNGAVLTSAQDSAPDIYETPELTDDNSTAPVRHPIASSACD